MATQKVLSSSDIPSAQSEATSPLEEFADKCLPTSIASDPKILDL
jgi:hypothetical protein